MKLYHGTNCDFEKIDFMKSKPNKDFGRGFYLSANYEQALNMANIKCEQMDYGKPVVQEYIFDEECAKGLRCLKFDDYTEEWAEFILLNRNAHCKGCLSGILGPNFSPIQYSPIQS